MKRVRILRDGAIGDPGNARATVVHAKKNDVIELSDTSADMCVNVSKPPRAEYITDDESASAVADDPASGTLDPADETSGDSDEGKRSLLDRITGKGKDDDGEGDGKSSILE